MTKSLIVMSFMIIFVLIRCNKDDFYWDLIKMPEISYLSIESNDLNEFVLTSECKSAGNSKNVEMGFCWSINENPTVDDNLIPVNKKVKGSFSTTIAWTNISCYHFRAYVKNELGIVYSQDCIVNWQGVQEIPQVQTLNTSQVSFYSLNVNSNIVSNGGNPIIQKGVYLYDNPSGTIPIDTEISQDATNSFTVTFDNLIDGNTYYVRAFASTLAGTGSGNLLTVTLPEKYSIGDIGPAGGFIIYENPNPLDTWHYIESAPIDVTSSTAVWSPTISSTNVNSVDIGQGFPNSNALYSIYGNSSIYATREAINWNFGGFSDWVLPSFKELKLMKEQLFDQGIGNFINEMSYWSSSEDENYFINAWTVKMTSSNTNAYTTQGKNQLFKIRAVRRF